MISFPKDLTTRLNAQAAIGRYPSAKSCMERACDLGLSVMEDLEKQVGTIVNKVAQIDTRQDGEERRSTNVLGRAAIGVLVAIAFLVTLVNVVNGQDKPADQSKPGAIRYKVPAQPHRFDWSFTKDARFWTGLGVTSAGLFADQATSHGPEANRFLRNSKGELNRGKQALVWGGLNALFLPLDFAPDRRWRWVSMGGRCLLGFFSFKAAIHNAAHN